MKDFMFSLEKIIEKIVEHSKIDQSKVHEMILEKQNELSGLVSEEGAAYMVARELGVSLLKETKRQFKIKNLIPGLNAVDIVGKVVNIYEPREFEFKGKKGKVQNIVLGDETGVVRLSLWNQEIDMISSGKLNEGDTIKITRGYVKSDNRDNPELRIGRGMVEKVDQVVDLPEIKQIDQNFNSIERSDIANFKEGKMYETRAVLVQVFSRNPFFEVCPECGSKVTKKDDKFICDDHGKVEPKKQLLLSGMIDDGTGNIRIVAFRELAEKIFGKTTEELVEKTKKDMDPMSVFASVEGLGKEFVFSGRVKKNSYTEREEFIINSIDSVNIKKEAEDLLKTLQ